MAVQSSDGWLLYVPAMGDIGLYDDEITARSDAALFAEGTTIFVMPGTIYKNEED